MSADEQPPVDLNDSQEVESPQAWVNVSDIKGNKDEAEKKSEDDDDVPEPVVIKPGDTNTSSLHQTFLGYNDPGMDDAVAKCTKNRITFKDLSSLDNDDLKMLGVKNESTRLQMVEDFSQFPAQGETFQKYMKNLKPEEFSKALIHNVTDHLNHLCTALSMAKLQMETVQMQDVLCEEKKVSGSELTIKVVDRMLDQVDQMEILLGALTGHKFARPIHREPKQETNTWKWLGLSLISAGAGFFLFNRLRK